MNENKTVILSMVAFVAILYLASISIYFTPFFQHTAIDDQFKNYYQAYSRGDPVEEQLYYTSIYNLVDKRLWPNPNDPIERIIWVGMFSGNEDIALVSGCVHFDYLVKTKQSSIFSIFLIVIIYTSSLLVGVSSVTHNIFTFTFRLSTSPTRAYLIYFSQLCHQYDIDHSSEDPKPGTIPTSGYIKALIAFFPAWLIGLSVGYVAGNYELYRLSSIFNPILFGSAHMYCSCAGSIIVILWQQLIRFLFMKANINITKSHIDDFLCILLGIIISTVLFSNGFGTTISVALGTFLFSIAQKSTKELIDHKRWYIEEPGTENRVYKNNEYGFSFIIPAGWMRRKLLPQFSSTGGQVDIKDEGGRASLNISVGPIDRELKNKERRGEAVRIFLLNSPGRNENISIDTATILEGEPNTVIAEYLGNWPTPGIPIRGKNGLISIIHNDLEYVIRWSALPDFEDTVREIISSFQFDIDYMKNTSLK